MLAQLPLPGMCPILGLCFLLAESRLQLSSLECSWDALGADAAQAAAFQLHPFGHLVISSDALSAAGFLLLVPDLTVVFSFCTKCDCLESKPLFQCLLFLIQEAAG